MIDEHPVIEEVLLGQRAELGRDFDGYRNHVYRVLNYFRALSPTDEAPSMEVLLGAAFHDIAIWTDGTFDYLEPSVRRAEDHLRNLGLGEIVNGEEVRDLIVHHHKITTYKASSPWAATVDRWRQADLIDVSWGLIRFSLPRERLVAIQARFPDAGFHFKLLRLTFRQLLVTPWRPLPMVRW